MQLLQTEDGSYTLLDPDQQETYHSKFGALTETDQVYLRNSGVYDRLVDGLPTSILEIGFGTGLNFVHTASHAIRHRCLLDYTACDFLPLDSTLVLELLNLNVPQQTDLCEFTSSAINQLAAPTTEVSLAFDPQTKLQLARADVTTITWPKNTFDAIYLDAFSKKNNPALWRTEFLQKLHFAAKPNAVLATYSVNGEFRAALTKAGFDFRKLPGPKGKREVLVATPR